MDYQGENIDPHGYVLVRNAMSCGALCEAYQSCAAWIFSMNYGRCWLKDKKPMLKKLA
ncbi:unnamed protein product, partial [Rotaria magnacalcarata]